MDGSSPLFPGGPPTTPNTFIRVISLSIAFYDYLITLPAEWRFYSSQRSWRLSPGCILFIAIRYTSFLTLLLSNLGFFGNFFSPEMCRRYFMVVAVFKVTQVTVSQLILAIRTVNIARRSQTVTIMTIAAFALFTTAQWFLNLYNRIPVQSHGNNCTVGNRPPSLTVWLFYVLAICFDLFALGISTIYLVGIGPNGKMARLVKIMLADGLVYFVALTAVNILNLFLYRSRDETKQSSAVSLGTTLTWIMSQRILIHLRDAAEAHNRPETTQGVVSHRLTSALSISRAMRSQFETKDRNLSSAFDVDWSYTSAPHESELAHGESLKRKRSKRGEGSRSRVVERSAAHSEGDEEAQTQAGVPRGGDRRRHDSIDEEGEDELELELDVQVQVEHTVSVEYDPAAYARESYRQPRVLWRHPGPDARRGRSNTGDEGAPAVT